jgi:hypothetical protein
MPRPSSESARLTAANQGKAPWRQWGPYLSERAWGTVREDYSPNGDAWSYLTHEMARSRAYRWGEDGLLGISDDKQYLCFALALWNGADPILKERIFGLTGTEGNHGEDVKDYYYYLDSTPTHSLMRGLYRYPQAAFPYAQLVAGNAARGYDDPEYELLDTGVFDEGRYFDVEVTYAKAAVDDILIRIRITNRGPEAAPLTVLPTLWFRNTWSWGYAAGPMGDVPQKPVMRFDAGVIHAEHAALGDYHLAMAGADAVLFTENETNYALLYGGENAAPYTKDAFHRALVAGEGDAVNPAQVGTKAAPVYRLSVAAGATETIDLRLSAARHKAPFRGFDAVLAGRQQEADAFYEAIHRPGMSDDEKGVQRQALAGMLWGKQLYYYDIKQWYQGDPVMPPLNRQTGRNREWQHLNNFDIISMPDKWEYPWYATWDLAFHCVALAMVDSQFAKDQLLLLTQEWYMHPNGQLPAYEWSFSDVNPPTYAAAALRLYLRDGARDKIFLKRIFNKLLLNFTWWINRKDPDGNNVFQGGFLGLDNISVFDRSQPLPSGGSIDQSDGTAWMGFLCLMMLNMAIELAEVDPAYEDMTVKFYEHFLWIGQAISGDAASGTGLWDEADGFFYDVLHLPAGPVIPLRIRSLVGLLPLIAALPVEEAVFDRLPGFNRSITWLQKHRPQLIANLMQVGKKGVESRHMFAIPTEERLRRVLAIMLDEAEFLSPYGLRSLSKAHEVPYVLELEGRDYSVQYWPGESRSGMFGGNSNWRGPIWLPTNYLLVDALRRYHRFYGDAFQVECPTGSGAMMTLDEVADEIARRLTRIFLNDETGRRAVFGGSERPQQDPHWHDHLLFYEYFHGDDGSGLGASHQTGWTGLIANLLDELHRERAVADAADETGQ